MQDLYQQPCVNSPKLEPKALSASAPNVSSSQSLNILSRIKTPKADTGEAGKWPEALLLLVGLGESCERFWI